MKILISGGAGFVGTKLACLFASENHEVHALDNLMRRGSEYNLAILKKSNVKFLHGDIRNQEDFLKLDKQYDLFIEASAEPSVHAGVGGPPSFVINNNLIGAINCFEFARAHCPFVVFLSSSRVYSIPDLLKIKLDKTETRFEHREDSENGLSKKGITENFSVKNYRSFYGSTKLCAEQLLQEYSAFYGVNAVINRCGVLCGEGQWGKTDQGVFTLWVARHFFKGNLTYTGFGGKGLQVRDILHPQDLFELIKIQTKQKEKLKADIYNVGGGVMNSVSLQEYTTLCQKITGNQIEIAPVETTASVDVPYYVTDNSKAFKDFNWGPQISKKLIVERIATWLGENPFLKDLFL